jgi:hypothetical protein
MNSSTKLHLGSAGYSTLLVGMNWSRPVEYSRQFGLKSESVAPIALAYLLSAGVVLYLVYRCVRSALSRLESGRKVRQGRWIRSWVVILYALPLLWHQNSSSSWREPDGAFAIATGGYGHALSSWVFLFAVLGLLLFQIFTRLTSDDEDAEPGTDNFGASPLRV